MERATLAILLVLVVALMGTNYPGIFIQSEKMCAIHGHILGTEAYDRCLQSEFATRNGHLDW